jgi:probable rRNA maturation factor
VIAGNVDIVDDSLMPLHDLGVTESRLRGLVGYLLEALYLDPECELSLAFVSEDAMAQLHMQWMDEPGSTDVLSFPMDDLRAGTVDQSSGPGLLGDIVVCPQVAQRQAEAAGHSLLAECELLVTHGVLHLLGHDHYEPEEHAVMFGLQDRLLAGWRVSTAESGEFS